MRSERPQGSRIRWDVRGHWLAAAVVTSCALSPAVARAQGGGTIDGVVRDAAGAPVLGAVVGVAGSASAVRTDEDGRFVLRNVAAGSTRVGVRRLGFEPAHTITMVPSGGAVTVTIRLVPVATTLAAVRVTARPEAFEGRLAGFERRRARGAGNYIGRERIANANSRSVIDMLRTAPSVRIVRGAPGQPYQAVRFRGAKCAPLLFIDGVPASAGEFDMNMIDLTTLDAIELYPSLSSIPPEFLGPRGTDQCGVIAVWSRPFRPRPVSEVRVADPQALVDSGHAYPADSVDVVAQLDQQSAEPAYPDGMWRQGQGGHVVAEFVVDTSGSVEMNTVVIVSATTREFAEAVRGALATASFAPAMRNGRAVRQVVHQPFDFIAPDPSREGAGPPSPR